MECTFKAKRNTMSEIINPEELGNYKGADLKRISCRDIWHRKTQTWTYLDEIVFPEKDDGYETLFIKCGKLKNKTLILPKYKKLKNIEIHYTNADQIIFHPECTNVELIDIESCFGKLQELNIPKTYKKLNWFGYKGPGCLSEYRVTKINLQDFKYLKRVQILDSSLTELVFRRECILKYKRRVDTLWTHSNKFLKRIIVSKKNLPLYSVDPKARIVSHEAIDVYKFIGQKIRFKYNLPIEIIHLIFNYIY